MNGATLTIDAEDVGCAGLDTVEYRVNSDAEEDWVAYEDPVPFEEDGEYAVDYRATDDNGNVSEIGTATFTVVTIEDSRAADGDRGGRGHPGPARLLRRERGPDAHRRRRDRSASESTRSSTG